MVEPNSWLFYPNVPKEEEDPYARINVMITAFNAETDNNSKRGLFQEIYTAIYLVTHGKITHGKQISRALSPAEKGTCKGDSQMILVPMERGNSRELDMVYEENGLLYIVEAKNTRKSDFHQLLPNIQLAYGLRAGIVYGLAQTSQESSLRTQYNAQPLTRHLPHLQVIQIPQRIGGAKENHPDGHLPLLPTLYDIKDFVFRRNHLGESIDLWDLPWREWAPFPGVGLPAGVKGTPLNLPVEPMLPGPVKRER